MGAGIALGQTDLVIFKLTRALRAVFLSRRKRSRRTIALFGFECDGITAKMRSHPPFGATICGAKDEQKKKKAKRRSGVFMG